LYVFIKSYHRPLEALRAPDFEVSVISAKSALDGGKYVSTKQQPPSTPEDIHSTHFS
jgi:hypothetical protein